MHARTGREKVPIMLAKMNVPNALFLVLGFVLLSLACGTGGDAPPERHVEAELALDEFGNSEVFEFVIPEQTRSMTVIAEGAADQLLGISSLMLGDGEDLVNVDVDSPLGEEMRERYFVLQNGQMPGNLSQSIRLGTFSHVYPYAPGLDLVPGRAEIRMASTALAGTIKLRILMPEDDGATALHLNLIRVAASDPEYNSDELVEELDSLLGPAGIDVVVDEFVQVIDVERATISDFFEPQEMPTSQSAALALWGREQVASDALNVFIVDSLPFGVGGLALGTPGPPDPESYYFGVLSRFNSNSAQLARVTAHELAHFLALQHVENRDLAGTVTADPIADTEPGQDNLMEQGRLLTPGQSFALARSALLTLE